MGLPTISMSSLSTASTSSGNTDTTSLSWNTESREDVTNTTTSPHRDEPPLDAVDNNIPRMLPTIRIPDYTFDAILIGEPGVGKTSLIQRYVRNVYAPDYFPTVVADVTIKSVEVGGQLVTLNLWDTGGMERFRSLNQNFVRSAHGVVLTYSYGDETDSLKSIPEWLTYTQSHGLKGAATILVGNKRDLPDKEGSITTEDGKKLARQLKLPFSETSAYNKSHVDAMFNLLVVDMILKVQRNQIDYRNRLQYRLGSELCIRGDGQERNNANRRSGLFSC